MESIYGACQNLLPRTWKLQVFGSLIHNELIIFSETVVESNKTSTKRPETENRKKEMTLDIKDIFREATVKQYKPIFFKKETIVID